MYLHVRDIVLWTDNREVMGAIDLLQYNIGYSLFPRVDKVKLHKLMQVGQEREVFLDQLSVQPHR